MTQNIDFLKEVLSIPSKTYREELMVQYLVKWLTENNIEHFVDEHKNVYATKQESSVIPEDFYFPCVVSHTDTVHDICNINIDEEQLYNAQGELKYTDSTHLSLYGQEKWWVLLINSSPDSQLP